MNFNGLNKRLKIGCLYKIYYVNPCYDHESIEPCLYLGFEQDESVKFIKTDHKFLDIRNCKKFCLHDITKYIFNIVEMEEINDN